MTSPTAPGTADERMPAPMRALNAGPLRLEPLEARHAKRMFAVLSDPALYEFENGAPPSEDWLHERYTRLQTRESADGTELWLNWVVHRPDDEPIGYVQASVLPGDVAYIAYEFGSAHWRQGFGSAAVAVMLAQLRSAYGVRHLVAVFKAANFRSRGLLLKLGFGHLPADFSPPWPAEADEDILYRH